MTSRSTASASASSRYPHSLCNQPVQHRIQGLALVSTTGQSLLVHSHLPLRAGTPLQYYAGILDLSHAAKVLSICADQLKHLLDQAGVCNQLTAPEIDQ